MPPPIVPDLPGQEIDAAVDGIRNWAYRPWRRFWGPTWRRRGGLGGTQLPLEVFLMGLILVAAPYFITNNIAEARGVTVLDPEMGFDRDIPVIYWTILPYALLYLFYPVTLLVCPRDDRGRAQLIAGMQGLITVTAFCCLIFLLLPAEIDMRDQIDWAAMNAWETALFEFIHASDNPWNAWPSLHIVHSYLLARMMTYWTLRKEGNALPWTAFRLALWIEWSLLCISIMTTKQHFAFDLLAGIIVAQFAWMATKPILDEIDEMGPSNFAEKCGWTD